MKKIRQKNNLWFAGAWICIFASNLFAVTLQFLKGDVLDQALLKEAGKTAGAALLLIVMILCETGFYFCFRLFQERFVTGCTGCLKQEIFRSTLNRNYISYREKQTGEYLAKYTNEADTVRSRYLSMQLVFRDIFLKVVFVGAALFILNVRIAVVTFVLLTMPLYVPKLIEKKLVAAQEEYLEAVKENLAAVNDWLSGMEVIKNFSLEAKIMERFGKSCSNMTDVEGRKAGSGLAAFDNAHFLSFLFYRTGMCGMACCYRRVFGRRFFCGGRYDRPAFLSAHLSGGGDTAADSGQTGVRGDRELPWLGRDGERRTSGIWGTHRVFRRFIFL